MLVGSDMDDDSEFFYAMNAYDVQYFELPKNPNISIKCYSPDFLQVKHKIVDENGGFKILNQFNYLT